MNNSTTSHTSDLNPQERDFYQRFLAAHEAYAEAAWELERLAVKAKKKKENPQDAALLKAQAAADEHIAQALGRIKELVQEITRALPDAKKFGATPIRQEGLANTIQQRIERERLEASDAAHPNILKTALLNMFVEREKTTRASIYKKRFRSGFKQSAESFIQEERQKNAAWREGLLQKFAGELTPEDIALIRDAFALRMARHGEEVL